MKRFWFLYFFVVTAQGHPLDDWFQKMSAKSSQEVDHSLLEMSESQFGWWVPVQNLEYRFGFDDFEFDKTHTLRLHLKSFSELGLARQSARLRKKISNLSVEKKNLIEKTEECLLLVQAVLGNQVYLAAKEHLELREKSLQGSRKILGLPGSSLKDLVSEMDKVSQVKSELSLYQDFFDEEFKESDRKVLSEGLLERVPTLFKKIKAQTEISNYRDINIFDETEMQLEDIDERVSLSDKNKFISYFELKQNTASKEKSYQVAVNIPWPSWDGETRARKASLHLIKKKKMELESTQKRNRYQQELRELGHFAEKFQGVSDRLIRFEKIKSKVKSVREAELNKELVILVSELKSERYLKALDFYRAYLRFIAEYMNPLEMQGRNFLQSDWARQGS